MKLYMIQIGFRLPGMNTEGHDTLFVIAESQVEAYKMLKAKRAYAQHVDTCLEVHQVEDQEVLVTSAPHEQDLKLWFLNLGGYRPGQFGEVHKCLLLTGKTLDEVKKKAKQDAFFTEEGLVTDPKASPHIDDKHCLDDGIDDVLCVSNSLEGYGIELRPDAATQSNELTIAYTPL
jgi:hypothetical protein